MLFAAISGSSPATCAAIGEMGIQEMRKRGYPDGVAAGSITAGGALGVLIPPSVTMIPYGIAQDIALKTILKGSLPFVASMVVAIVILCLFPGIATWLPDAAMGART